MLRTHITKHLQRLWQTLILSRSRIDPRLPGERALADRPLPAAGPLPERVVNVQIDVQAVDEELAVSWVNADGLAEVLRETRSQCKSNAKTPG